MSVLVPTLLVGGVDIRSMPGFSVVGYIPLHAPGQRRGQDETIPGRVGQLPVPGLPFDAYSFSAPVWIAGATPGQREANLRTAAATLLGPTGDGLVTLTRRLVNATDDGFDEATAQGRFVAGLSFQVLNPWTGSTELQFVNLDGGWTRSSDGVFVVP